MKRHFFFLLLVTAFTLPGYRTGFCTFPDDIWTALEKHDRKQARELLNAAIGDSKTRNEATLILILLNRAEDQPGNLALMKRVYASLDSPSPYIYALWQDDAVTNRFLLNDPQKLAFLKQICQDPRMEPGISAGMHYILGMQQLFANRLDNAIAEWASMNALGNWQFTGHFDNTSGSGFDKDYDPVRHPEPSAHFISRTNSDIHWFSPKYPQRDAWRAPGYYIPVEQGIVYAQTFVESPTDQQVVMTLGGAGSLKLWLNDNLLVRQESELRTELDLYKQPVLLHKGVNRVLVQVGFTEKTDFPNYLVRILDLKGQPVGGLTSLTDYQPYPNDSAVPLAPAIPHFAEKYFQDKILRKPADLLSMLLLNEIYYRNRKLNEAANLMLEARKQYPGNLLVEMALLRNYNKLNDRTQVLKQLELIRAAYPGMAFVASYDFTEHMDLENYAQAANDLAIIGQTLGVESETYVESKIKLLVGTKDYPAMTKLIEESYRKFPENTNLLTYQFLLLKNNSDSPDAPAKLLENYLDTHFDVLVEERLIEEYTGLNNYRKMEEHYLHLRKFLPEEIKYPNYLAVFYYNQKEYNQALRYVDEGLMNAPFHASYWSNKGYINEALGNTAEAISHLQKAVHYNPNLFDTREKLRKLNNLQPIESYFGNPDDEKLILSGLEDQNPSDQNFEYLFNEHDYVLYPEGAAAEYTRLAVKINNETGAKKWKENQIDYNSQSQELTVEKAEVWKKNGEKVTGEQSQNMIVFPSLDPGDVVYIVYRFENYTGGKLAKELWMDHVFNDFVPVKEDKLRVFVPKNVDFIMQTKNLNLDPKKIPIDEFTCYEWTVRNPVECKGEPLMPSLMESGMALHLSTVKSWSTISAWYRDIALPQAKEEYNLQEVYDQLFIGKGSLSDREKAMAIYNYLCDNIRSSFVSFRQSNYTPQTPMVTLSTKLGDCKDLSVLYHTLARKAGLKTHLVLVNTRDNGEASLTVPSVNFNHCIVRIDLPDGPVFQEMTDAELGFGIMPNIIVGAQALMIPNTQTDTVGSGLFRLPGRSSIPSTMSRKTNCTVSGTDLRVTTSVTSGGAIGRDYRDYFTGLTREELKETVKNYLIRTVGSNLNLDTFSLSGLQQRNDPVGLSTTFSQAGEVKSIGGMKVVKVTFFDKIFTLDGFPDDKRVHDIQYWEYENNDSYLEEYLLTIPAEAKFIEIPEQITISNAFINYTLTITKVRDNKVKIIRNADIHRETIPAGQYDEFRKAALAIVKAEDLYFAYK